MDPFKMELLRLPSKHDSQTPNFALLNNLLHLGLYGDGEFLVHVKTLNFPKMHIAHCRNASNSVEVHFFPTENAKGTALSKF